MKILLMEDDPKLTSFLKIGLERNDCTLDVASDGNTGEKLALSKKYDVIILDVIVPGLNGFEVCQRIRHNNIKTPVLMLTSLDSLEDKITGFESGADDYLLKPFNFQELLARIKALNRRSKDIFVDPFIKISGLEIDTVAKKVRRDNNNIKLTAIEYKLLELLASHKGKVFERFEITEKVWNASFNSGTNVIDVHVNSLRKKIDKGFSPKLIHTVVGIGYELNDDY